MAQTKHAGRMAMLAFLFSAVVRADFPAPEFEIVNPRPYGRVIGDLLVREIAVKIPSSYVLDRASLPQVGPLDDWIEVRPAVVDESTGFGRVRYRITLTYQIMGSPESVVTLALPEVTLIFRRAEQYVTKTVPDWPIAVAPLAPTNILARAGLQDMLPDRAPSLIRTRPLELRLGGYAVLIVLIVLYLGYCQFGWFSFEGAGPFARAHRDLKTIAKQDRDGLGIHTAMRRLHRAFDQTAGRTVFASQLNEFFASHPRFAAARKSIESFFDRSRQEFFGGGEPNPIGFAVLIALCRECYRCERHKP